MARVAGREATVGVVGLGYVGLPLLLEFAKASFPVLGFDVDAAKVSQLKAGKSYIRHIDEARVRQFLAQNPNGDATADFARVAECDAILICVPTPLTIHREPDMQYIESTAMQVGGGLRRGQLVVLESTTYPGTTDEVLIPGLEAKSGLKAGVDFFVAYSPEREDPNNKDFSTSTIPKVVGGFTPDSLEVAKAFYDCVICRTIPVSDCRTAEATKLLENIFRCINIALVNELKMVFSEMGVDVWEVIHAASTKPFGFMPFYPGPGLGGHCIPIDPFYLTWKAREYGMPTKFIELAGEINTSMPEYVVRQTLLALNEHKKTVTDSRLLLVGLAYKKNVDDDRESPTYVLWERFARLGAKVDYYDPFFPTVRPTRHYRQFAGIRSRTWKEIQKGQYDVAVIATAHDCVDHDALARRADLVIDTRGACAPAPNVVKA
ncbi:MAG: UDP-N-acetyl-D-glucosamine dehydrogenase [Lentisphaerae bacterium RIFOXYB12_FULL_65_16]|nr:MAG: UDP-N-acetyl-D-glucosamine dehydrogenase [Lentisphaerae bacterium RIFOXYA12_64_32]OGV92325.1 MAG: UDP-N-acetyl-D-glucosamine dehydrogenase [Lentisphaerae bacterium RIFOXYB12_FULL_65_16]